MNRRGKHIRFVLSKVTDLNNEINQLSIKITLTKEDSQKERFFISKMRIKASLLKKYSRRLKTLSI